MQKLTKSSQDWQRSIGYIDAIGGLTVPSTSNSLEKSGGKDVVDDDGLAILADQSELFRWAWFLVQVSHDAVVVVVSISNFEVGPRDRPLYR